MGKHKARLKASDPLVLELHKQEHSRQTTGKPALPFVPLPVEGGGYLCVIFEEHLRELVAAAERRQND